MSAQYGVVQIDFANKNGAYALQPVIINSESDWNKAVERINKKEGIVANSTESPSNALVNYRDLSFDSRTLLSNALATTAQNDIERKYIEEYQSKIANKNKNYTHRIVLPDGS